MSHIQIPTVTLEDLQAFQAKHFPKSAQSFQLEQGSDDYHSYEVNEVAEDDELGYYPDGVKRTLTDEQIRIFRHTEVHALLRAKQLREDEEAFQRSSGSAEAGSSGENSTVKPERVHDATATLNDRDAKVAGNEGKVREPKLNASTSNRPAAVASSASLDYNEESDGQQNTYRQTPSQFTRRRIISYED